MVNHTLTYVAKLRLWRLKKSKSNIPSFSYPCFRLVYSSIDSVRRVCKEIISTLKVDGTTKQINKQKRRKECSEKFTDVECTQCVLRSAQVIFSKTMFRIRKTETVDNFSNIRNEKTWPFKTEAFQHMGNQRSSSHEEFEFAPVSCCCLHCRE